MTLLTYMCEAPALQFVPFDHTEFSIAFKVTSFDYVVRSEGDLHLMHHIVVFRDAFQSTRTRRRIQDAGVGTACIYCKSTSHLSTLFFRSSSPLLTSLLVSHNLHTLASNTNSHTHSLLK